MARVLFTSDLVFDLDIGTNHLFLVFDPEDGTPPADWNVVEADDLGGRLVL
jgi:hypothetical protein